MPRANESYLSQLDNVGVMKVPGAASRFWREDGSDLPGAIFISPLADSSLLCTAITTTHRLLLVRPLPTDAIGGVANGQVRVELLASIPLPHLVNVQPSGPGQANPEVTLSFFYPLRIKIAIPIGQNPPDIVSDTIGHWMLQSNTLNSNPQYALLNNVSLPLLNATTEHDLGSCVSIPIFRQFATKFTVKQRWAAYNPIPYLKKLQDAGMVSFRLADGHDLDGLDSPLDIQDLALNKENILTNIGLHTNEALKTISLASLFEGYKDSLNALLEGSEDAQEEETASIAPLTFYLCPNKNYALCPTYPSLLILPHSSVVQPTFYMSGRFPCVGGLIAGKALYRSGNPILGDGPSHIEGFYKFFLQTTPYRRLVVMSIGKTTYFDYDITADCIMFNSMGVPVDGRTFIRVLGSPLPSPNELINSFDSMYTTSLMQEKQFITSGLDSNWAVQKQGTNLYNVAEEVFNAFHVKSIKEGSESQYGERAERTNWLDYIIQTLVTARVLSELLEDEGGQNMVLLSGEFELLWGPPLIILTTLFNDQSSRTITGFMSLLRQQFGGFGLPLASCLNGKGAKIGFSDTAIQSPLITLIRGHIQVPIITLLLDCVMQLIFYSPSAFGFTAEFILQLQSEIHSDTYGDFLFNFEAERYYFGIPLLTDSIYSQEAIQGFEAKYGKKIHASKLDLSSWPVISGFWALGTGF
ncbi:Myotubularin-like phosphatase [Giardia muris]|uniref:Myotubularin-like phosphatase n=1 Tax=Giardia muris TaxID=5742 RepID=A0A4Z1TDL0_GIAMU|nr:Myotubularin-like phosphatase [Giardia muris]|eukprot:TNJ30639.1 Myotubularin-like phosphatase [Giardia muris]